MNRAMTKEEFRHAYQVARESGPTTIQPDHPARLACLARRSHVDYLAYREQCAKIMARSYKPLGVALKLYKIRKLYNTPANRSPQRSVPRPGFVQLVDRELTIKSWLQWGRCETELDEQAGGLWVFADTMEDHP